LRRVAWSRQECRLPSVHSELKGRFFYERGTNKTPWRTAECIKRKMRGRREKKDLPPAKALLNKNSKGRRSKRDDQGEEYLAERQEVGIPCVQIGKSRKVKKGILRSGV